MDLTGIYQDYDGSNGLDIFKRTLTFRRTELRDLESIGFTSVEITKLLILGIRCGLQQQAFTDLQALAGG